MAAIRSWGINARRGESAMEQGFPIIRVEGEPYDRGHQYGNAAQDRITVTIEAYKMAFAHFAHLDWPDACARAQAYMEEIEAYAPEALAEMRGIADGAGRRLEEILALNARTEIMLTANICCGCTAVAVLPELTVSGHTFIGQNWDWISAVKSSCVLLQVKQPDKPDFLTFVEAGLLAKTGLNSAGIGLCANALISDQDRGEKGVPFHVILRKILDASRLDEAIAAVILPSRASSANYLLASVEGEAIDLEAAPPAVGYHYPLDGFLTHTNHFTSGLSGIRDVGLTVFPDSLIRDSRAYRRLKRWPGKIDRKNLEELFRDHVNFPHSICRHPDPQKPPAEQIESVGSVIMDLDRGELFLSDGPPCTHAYRRVSLRDET
ncbi:MAG: peptidase C45 [Nitrospinota bacterium]|nr:MAG: peptidase C45 [Nitrospinota bacterium]